MRTEFSLAQLADPDIVEADKILRACVHCGFCTATCPTYVLLGDELDSPRGRISLIKEMLEKDQAPTQQVVKHIDRCLSCLACMTTCPSGVHYMHLVDQARVRIEQRYVRPVAERLLRAVLAFVLPRPRIFRAGMMLARLVKPFAGLLPSAKADQAMPTFFNRLKAMLALAPRHLPPRERFQAKWVPVRVKKTRQNKKIESRSDSIGTEMALGPVGGAVFPALGRKRGRVALLQGCAQQVLSPGINEAATRMLTRQGIEVVLVANEQCCGSLTHHMGWDGDALRRARHNIDVWIAEADCSGLDAILVTTSGCGTTLKDYGYMLREDAAYAAKAARVSGLARDIVEYIDSLNIVWPLQRNTLVVAYHSACSLQHGQKITQLPKELLSKSGFMVKDVLESHLCCGSAGTYNILQPGISERLRERKIAHIRAVKPDVIATGNIGCIVQIAGGTSIPVVHTIELLDWATGGPRAFSGKVESTLPLENAPINNWRVF